MAEDERDPKAEIGGGARVQRQELSESASSREDLQDKRSTLLTATQLPLDGEQPLASVAGAIVIAFIGRHPLIGSRWSGPTVTTSEPHTGVI